MHELSLAVSLVEEVEEVLEREQASQVLELLIKLGDLSGVEREAFEACFPMAAEGTALESAKLTIEEVPGHEFKISSMEVV